MGLSHAPRVITDGLVLALDAEPNPRYVDYAGRGANFSASGDYLTIADSNVFSPGTGDYTIEGWFRWTSNGWWNRLVSADDGSSTSMYLYTFRNNEPAVYINGAYMNPTVSPVFVYNQWYHMAVSRVSGTTYFFRNGVLLQSSTNATLNGSITSSNVRICTSLTSPQQFYGDASNVRIVVGDGLASHYTSAFTPPTEPLTAVSGTTLLLCQNGSFTKDNSGYSRTVTTNGSPARSSLDLGTPFGDWFNLANNTGIGTLTNGPVFTQEPKLEPFGGAGAVYFDGTGDYLSLANTTCYLGANDFTIEAWVYWAGNTALSSLPAIISKWSSTGGPFQFLVNASGFSFQYTKAAGGQLTATGTTAPSANRWYHIAAVKYESELKLYVDGVLEATTTGATAILNRNDNVQIGHRTWAGPPPAAWDGYISNLRLTRTALYTSNFTPPRKKLEATSDTVLLTCEKGTIKDRSSSAHAITINGDAKSISGASYFEFDGTNDYVAITNTANLRLGNEDFTIESWVQFGSGLSGSESIFGVWDNTNNQRSYLFYYDSSGDDLYFSASSDGAIGGITNVVANNVGFTANRWYHLVASRISGTTTIYIDGVSSASGTQNFSFYNNTTDTFAIGAANVDHSITNQLKGKISNVKVHKGKGLTASEVEQNFNAFRGRYGI